MNATLLHPHKQMKESKTETLKFSRQALHELILDQINGKLDKFWF